MNHIKHSLENSRNIKVALAIIIAAVAVFSIFGMGERFGEFLFTLLH